MAGKSLSGFKPYIQVEATPGTPVTDAMVQVDGLRMVRMGHGGQSSSFKGGTGKTASGVILSDDWGVWSVEPAADFRSLGVVAASRIAKPVTTQPDAENAATVYQHVFTLNPNAIDDIATYTMVWGDGTTNFQGAYGVFQSLGFTAARGQVTCSSGLITRLPSHSGISIPNSGVTTMAMKSIQPNKAYIYINGTWATIGTTQYLAPYNFDVQLGDKYDLDAPINGAIVSYASLPEKEDQSMAVNMSVAVDAAGLALIDGYQVGDMIAVRYKIEGPIIEDTFPFLCQWDVMLVITQVGEITSAPNSNIATVPLTCEVATDGTHALELTLQNDVETYDVAA